MPKHKQLLKTRDKVGKEPEFEVGWNHILTVDLQVPITANEYLAGKLRS